MICDNSHFHDFEKMVKEIVDDQIQVVYESNFLRIVSWKDCPEDTAYLLYIEYVYATKFKRIK